MHTIVQHSKCGYAGSPAWAHAVETRHVPSEAWLKKIEKVGGLVFEDYIQAEEFCEKANYPEGYEGMLPAARGTFSDVTVDGLKLYIPIREVVG